MLIFFTAPITMQEEAQRKAEIAELLLRLQSSVNWAERASIVREKFGGKGTSQPSLKRILSTVKLVDPINFAPALLANYKGRTCKAELSPDAWRFFMTMIRDAAPDWPLAEAWRRVRDAGKELNWSVPSYVTFYRRWTDLTEAQRFEARLGADQASKQIRMHAHRDKTTIGSLEWVSLDGRTKDFFVDWGDGKAVRSTFIALVDVASNVVLDWELAPSENAAATVRLIKRVCAKYGMFDRLYPDNRPAFSGNAVAGGSDYRFRFKTDSQKTNTMGICNIMGIKLQFAQVKNAQAKIAERVFATISRSIDDGPEFKGAHTGHGPGAKPTADVKPVSVEAAKAVLRRRIHSYNHEKGRRCQGAKGRSYWQIFQDGLECRANPLRVPTAHQLYLGGLIWKPVSVDRVGQVWINGWGYGDPITQENLLPYRKGGAKNPKGGVKINLGRDPEDFAAPAMAYDLNGKLICRSIESIKRGAYGSVDGIRDAARKRKAAKVDIKAAGRANNYLDDAAYTKAMAALDAAIDTEDSPMPPSQKVVGTRFGTPLQDKPPLENESVQATVPEEFKRNMDTALAAKRLQGGKLA